jgi:hypothetical protein
MEQINKKCAKFEGFIFSQNYESYDEYYGVWETVDRGVWYKEKDFIENPNPSELHFVKVDGKVLDDYEYSLRYDSDWNWLMRVKNKICQMDIVYEFETTFNIGYYCSIFPLNRDSFPTICGVVFKTELEATIDVIDKFLDWYSVNS